MRCSVPRLPTSAVLLALLFGCDSSGGAPYVEGSQEEATVKGTIKVKGKPVPAGTVHFNASNSKRIVAGRDAPIGPDGSFALKAYVGQNIVTVSPPRNLRGADARNRVYANLGDEEKFVDVKPGEENAVDLDMSP